MKKVLAIALFILTVIAIGIFSVNTQHVETDITKQKTKVLFLMNGSKNDNSWGTSHWISMQKIAQELNLDVDYHENIPADVSILSIIDRSIINSKTKIVIGNSFGFGPFLIKSAHKYPNTYFLHASGSTYSSNMASFFGRMYQMRFLSGIVAGLQTKSNKIGYIASFPISEVNRGINAFALGVQYVNKDAKVYVKWTHSWTSDDLAENKLSELLNEQKDIDVLAMHLDTNKILDIAEEKGIWSIGYNTDNAKLYPKTFLTAPIWKWENYYKQKILECLQNRFVGNNSWNGFESDIIDLAPLTNNVTPKAEEIINKVKQQLEDGVYDVFYGPIFDNENNLRVNTDENISDEILLNKFDWYVKGVQL